MSLFPHTCTITRPQTDTRVLDRTGGFLGDAPSDTSLYSDSCRVFVDEAAIRRLLEGDESIQGKALVRLRNRPATTLDTSQDEISATFNGVTKTGKLMVVQELHNYPRLLVRWD